MLSATATTRRGADSTMNKLEQIITQIKDLEAELLLELQEKQNEYLYVIKGKRVLFEEETRRYHKTLATRLHTYLANASLLNTLTAPIIYSCLLPALFMDLVVTFYQAICFRAYGIPRVARGDYILFDRYSLQYLNPIEKLHCAYCSYFTGLIAYVQEIAARTEQYWCPIKHARKMSSIHSRYHRFIEFGDSRDYETKLLRLRAGFSDVTDK
jgi:hypothetical protein